MGANAIFLNYFFTARQVNKCIFTCNPPQSGSNNGRFGFNGNNRQNARKKIGSCSVSLSASEYHHPGQPRDGSCNENGICSQGYPIHCQKCDEMCEFAGEPGTYERAVITLSVITNSWDNKPINRPARPKGKSVMSITHPS